MFGSVGQLSATSRIPVVYETTAEGYLVAVPRPSIPAAFGAEGSLDYEGGGSPATDFGSEGSLDTTSSTRADAPLGSEGLFYGTPVPITAAAWTAVGSLGLGAYEVEILTGVEFTSEGSLKPNESALNASSASGTGDLAAASRVQQQVGTSGEGSLLTVTQPLTEMLMTGSGQVALEPMQAAAAAFAAAGAVEFARSDFWINPFTVTFTSTATTTVPEGARFAHYVLIGGGGGGSGGNSGLSLTGNGGSAGPWETGTIDLSTNWTDTLRIRVGEGGAGGPRSGSTNASRGQQGGTTYLDIWNGTAWATAVIRTGGNGGNGFDGNQGTGSASVSFEGISFAASGNANSGSGRENGKLYGGGGGGGAGGIFGGGSSGMTGGKGVGAIRFT